ncbi:MAG: glycosyltransferase family 2 protein [Oscillatoria sp. SIO1A7]|nr:glycosyltransferase family 2 protein [Oscillatoria sp. SIO1A7]
MDASVSVIIPCYNCADTIHRAVESIIQQTLKPAEIILVDDGSSDNTLQELKLIQSKYGKDWIKVIALEKNTGVSNARNTAWDLSSQNYIAFLDADDAWHSEKLAIQYFWMSDRPDIALCGHAYKLINCQDEDLNLKIKPNFKTIVFSKEQMLLSNPFVTPSVMLKRNLNYRFNPNKRYCEDYLLWLQISLDGHQLAMIDTELAYLFKSFGKSGLSRNLLRMRWADINNYWQLWKSKRINIGQTFFLIAYSLIKLIPMILFDIEYYAEFKKRMIMQRFEGSASDRI